MTTPLYFDDTYRFEAPAKVLRTETREDGKTIVMLDQTIFYPQGGGQPYDTGTIRNANAEFTVTEVRKGEAGDINHIGQFVHGNFAPGDSVELKIDSSRRLINARLHSAGHLIDIVIKKLGYPLIPGKGYHFPEGAYIEYEGQFSEDELSSAPKKIEDLTNELIQEATDVRKEIMAKEDLAQKCAFTIDTMPDQDEYRVITVYGEKGCPCGGTHVANIREIGQVKIPKVSYKKRMLRVRYDLT
jgi:Ser-tRNA(Ala) deacylase AlaX